MKRNLIYTVALSLGFVAFDTTAGTFNCESPCCFSWCRPPCGIYVDGNIGISYQEWKRSGIIINEDTAAATLTHSLTNDPIGFTGGFDIGYKITRNFGAEFGAYFFPTVNAKWIHIEDGTATNGTAILSSWFGYTALKFLVPVYNSMDAFIKVGGAARSAHYENDLNGPGSSALPNSDVNSVNWLFGVGFQMYFNCNFSANVQWIHLTGASVLLPFIPPGPPTSGISIAIPPTDLLTVGFGMSF